MKEYMVRGEKTGDTFFTADSNPLAEEFVEQNFDEEEGKMTLYKLTPVCDWD